MEIPFLLTNWIVVCILDVYKRQGYPLVERTRPEIGRRLLVRQLFGQRLVFPFAADGQIAVSYTHLDVYKRQVVPSAAQLADQPFGRLLLGGRRIENLGTVLVLSLIHI